MESFPEITYFGHGIFAPLFMNQIGSQLKHNPEIYIQSAPNNSNETYTPMGLGRAGRFGQS